MSSVSIPDLMNKRNGPSGQGLDVQAVGQNDLRGGQK